MHMVSDKNIIVTGGAGFIGSHLVSRLAGAGARNIKIIDSMGYGSAENIAFIKNAPNVELIEADMKDISAADYEVLVDGVDYIFHLAAEKHNQSKDDAQRVLDVNVNASARLFEAAGKKKVSKIIFTSSLYANGRTALPAHKVCEPAKPTTVYGVSKLAGEGLLDYVNKIYNIDYANFRLYFIYGPKQWAGMGYKSVIAKNFGNLLAGKRPTINGSGKQSLDYVFVEDLIDLLLASVEKDTTGKVFNAGTGQAIDINDLTRKMQKVANTDLEPEFIAPDWTDGTHRVADNTQTKEFFNWTPKTSLEDGLKVTFDWIKSAGV